MSTRVRLSGRSHNPADRLIPRFDLMIPCQGAPLVADLTADQLAALQADPYVLVEAVAVAEPVVEAAPPSPAPVKRRR